MREHAPQNHTIMIFKRCLAITFMVTSLIGFSQEKVCESSGSDELDELHTIGKCAIENFKKSNTREFVRVSTRNRYLRKRKNSYLTNLKKNVSTNSAAEVKKDVIATVNKVNTSTIEAINTTTKVTETKVATTSVNSLGAKEVLVKNYVRFDQVSQIPVFITCNDANVDANKNCVKETFINNLLDNLIYPFDAAAEGIEGRVWVRFIIDKEGYVKNITTTGPENGALLEEEAKRLVQLLPKFIPGKHNNDYVNVEYFMPIDFQLDE